MPAAIRRLVEKAKLGGLEPEGYLRQVSERIAGHPINRIEELLPGIIRQRPAPKHDPGEKAARGRLPSTPGCRNICGRPASCRCFR